MIVVYLYLHYIFFYVEETMWYKGMYRYSLLAPQTVFREKCGLSNIHSFTLYQLLSKVESS